MYVHDNHFVDLEVCRLMVPSSALTSQGNSITLASGTNSYSAIDTGTTLIGGPQDAIEAIYANIPNSAPATGDFEGYYSYRECSTLPTQICIHDKLFASLQHRCERHSVIRGKELEYQLCRLCDDEDLC